MFCFYWVNNTTVHFFISGMNTIKKVIYYLIALISVFVIGATLLSLLYNTQLWWLKVLDFPRLQLLLVGALCLLVVAFMTHRWTGGAILLVLGLVASIGIQGYYIYPYTSVASTVVPMVSSKEASVEATVRILIANVYMHNRQVGSLLKMIEQTDPDMVLVMETNDWWMTALQPLRRRYAHVQEYPVDNTYGMGLYSRYPWSDMEVKFLQHDSVPSFHAKMQLPDGQSFYFHGVHPVPPVHSKHPDNAGEKEEELIEVGRMVAQHEQPAVVAGDFNDVAWSNTSRLFQTEGQLNDIRVGRGMYSSFDARSRIMRWPLDHVYVTPEFALADLQRLGDFGSDHFPIYIELVLTERE